MEAKIRDEHQWLQKLEGDWTIEGPGPDGSKLTGREKVKMVGGIWAICEGEGTMPDGTHGITVMTLGYDPTRGRYVGSWLGSMMDWFWIYDGKLRADGKALELQADGPNFEKPGELSRYKDVIEFITDDHRTLTAYAQQPDGTWTEIMRADYRRG